MRWECLDSVSAHPPSEREAHAAVLCNESLYVFGGYDGNWLDDLHSLDMKTWAWQQLQHQDPHPSKRSGHTMTAISSTSFLLFGGFNGGLNVYYNDCYVFETSDNQWNIQNCHGELPHGREAHSAIYLPHRQLLFIHGGYGRKQLGDLAILNLTTWIWSKVELLAGTNFDRSRLTRSKYSYAYDRKKCIFIMGGDCGGGSTGIGLDSSRNDLLLIDIERNNCEELEVTGDIPGARNGHSMVLVQGKQENMNQIILFGGTNGEMTYFNDVSSFDLQTNKWTSIQPGGNPPSGRENHTFTLLDNSKILLFGGCLGLHYSKEIYILHTAQLKMQKSKACVIQ